MKKWILSHNGDMTAPLTEVEAIAYLQQQPNCYAWHPSFSQWLPANKVVEFAGQIPDPTPLDRVPQELIADFKSRQEQLAQRLATVAESVTFSKTYLYELEQEINIYKRLTNKLSDEVKSGIASTEVSYRGYQKVLEQLNESLGKAKGELTDLVTEFEKCLEQKQIDLEPLQAAPLVTLSATAKAVAVGIQSPSVTLKESDKPAQEVPSLTMVESVKPQAGPKLTFESLSDLTVDPFTLDPLVSEPGTESKPSSEPAADDLSLAFEDDLALAATDEPSLAVEEEPSLAVEDELALAATDELSLALEDELAFAAKGELSLAASDDLTLLGEDEVLPLTAELSPKVAAPVTEVPLAVQVAVKPATVSELKPASAPQKVAQDVTLSLDPQPVRMPASVKPVVGADDELKAALERAALSKAVLDNTAAKVAQDKPLQANTKQEPSPRPDVPSYPIQEKTPLRPLSSAAVSLDPVATKTSAADFFAQAKARPVSVDPVASRPPADLDKGMFGMDPETFFAEFAPSPTKPVAPAPMPEAPAAQPAVVEVKAVETPSVDSKKAVSAKVAEEPDATEAPDEAKSAQDKNKLQSVTSIFKSVFKGDKKDEISFLGEAEAGPGGKSDEDDDEELLMAEVAEGEHEKGKDHFASSAFNEDIKGRMRRRSRRRS